MQNEVYRLEVYGANWNFLYAKLYPTAVGARCAHARMLKEAKRYNKSPLNYKLNRFILSVAIPVNLSS